MTTHRTPVIIRLATPHDVDGLIELAKTAGYGFTSLPPCASKIERRVEASISGEEPLLVMFPADKTFAQDTVIGCAGLTRQTGRPDIAEPFYAYRIERSIHESKRLGVRTEVDSLHLSADYDGSTLIGTLLLHPDWRGRGLGRVLSLSRFMLLASAPKQFSPTVIAELRGVITPNGQSVFWEAVGRHFFQVDYATADRLSAEDKRFIAALMPRHPIYIPLLPVDARQAIGEVHPDTLPAKRLLEAEGFYRASMVDIFDAGPMLRCDLHAIRTVKRASSVSARVLDPPDDRDRGEVCLVANQTGTLRIGCTSALIDDSHALIDLETARLLGVEDGGTILVSPLGTSVRNKEVS